MHLDPVDKQGIHHHNWNQFEIYVDTFIRYPQRIRPDKGRESPIKESSTDNFISSFKNI